jgi:hypothetical protein
MQILGEADVVDKRVTNVWKTPSVYYPQSEQHPLGLTICRLFVEIEDKFLFEVQSIDPWNRPSIYAISRNEVDLELVDEQILDVCKGSRIQGVYVSLASPTPLVLLSNNSLLQLADSFGPHLNFFPWITQLGEYHLPSELVSYWDEREDPFPADD